MRIGIDLAFFEDTIHFGIGLFSIQLLRGILSKDKNNTYVVFVTDMVYDEIKNEKGKNDGNSKENFKILMSKSLH